MTAVADLDLPETLALDEVLDLKAARPLAEALRAHRGQDLRLDASDVRRLGALCLQVLLSAQRTWAAEGRTLSIISPSALFSETWALLGARALDTAALDPAR